MYRLDSPSTQTAYVSSPTGSAYNLTSPTAPTSLVKSPSNGSAKVSIASSRQSSSSGAGSHRSPSYPVSRKNSNSPDVDFDPGSSVRSTATITMRSPIKERHRNSGGSFRPSHGRVHSFSSSVFENGPSDLPEVPRSPSPVDEDDDDMIVNGGRSGLPSPPATNSDASNSMNGGSIRVAGPELLTEENLKRLTTTTSARPPSLEVPKSAKSHTKSGGSREDRDGAVSLSRVKSLAERNRDVRYPFLIFIALTITAGTRPYR